MEKSKWTKLTYELVKLINLQTLYQRKNRFLTLYEEYPEELNIVCSFILQLNSGHFIVPKKYNNKVDEVDFEKDIGYILYHYINNGNTLVFRDYLPNLSYASQLLVSLLFTQRLKAKVTYDFMLDTVDNLYTLPELIAKVDIPDIISKEEFSFQGLSRNVSEQLQFPMYFVKIPKKVKRKTSLIYLIKDGDKVISNASSHAVRKNIGKAIPFTSYGLIGLVMSARGFKSKRLFIPLYVDESPTNIKDLYRGNGATINEDGFKVYDWFSKIETSIIVEKTKGVTKCDSSEELQAFLRTVKKPDYVVINPDGVSYLKPTVKYEKVPIVDYILDDNYEALGCKVDYHGEIVDVRFTLPDDLVTDGIKGRYINIQVTKFGEHTMAFKYNSTIKKWNRKFTSCGICNKVDYAHKTGGICSSCYGSLEKTALYNTGDFEIQKKVANKFIVYIHDYEITGDVDGIQFRQITGGRPIQKPLPFEWEDNMVKKGYLNE